MRSTYFGFYLLAAATFAAGRADASALDTSLHPLIVGGDPSHEDADAIVRIVSPRAVCTGTLLAADIVVTARHCLADITAGGFSCDEDGSVVGAGGRIIANDDPTSFNVYVGTTLDPRQTPSGHGRSIVDDGADFLCGHDFAILILDAPISGARTRKLATTAAVVGETVDVVGWGATAQQPLPAVRQERHELAVLRVGPATRDAFGRGLAAGEFELGESGCSGDSGAPALDRDGAILGVLSRGSGPAGSQGDEISGCVGVDARNALTSARAFGDVVARAYAAVGRPAPESQKGAMQGCNASALSPRREGVASVLLMFIAANFVFWRARARLAGR
jgi:hypothetical protein